MSAVAIDPERLATITELRAGGHASIEQGACVMEALSFVAREPWSDQPRCCCPVVAGLTRALNDRMPDDQRQRLIPYIVRMAGSKATPEVERSRAYLAATWAVKVFAPLALETRGHTERAAKLRALPDITDTASARDARAAAYAYAAAAGAAAAAAYAAAADAGAGAAYAAAAAAAAAYAAAADAGAGAGPVWDEALACLDALLLVGA